MPSKSTWIHLQYDFILWLIIIHFNKLCKYYIDHKHLHGLHAPKDNCNISVVYEIQNLVHFVRSSLEDFRLVSFHIKHGFEDANGATLH